MTRSRAQLQDEAVAVAVAAAGVVVVPAAAEEEQEALFGEPPGNARGGCRCAALQHASRSPQSAPQSAAALGDSAR